MVSFGISEGISYDIFVTVSFVVATIVKYIFDKFWAFEKSDKKQVGTEFTKFFAITLVSWGIQLGAAHVVVNVIGPQLGMNALIWGSVGKIAGIGVAFIWNFVGYKFVVFKK